MQAVYIYSVHVLNIYLPITKIIIKLMLFFRLQVNAANMNDKPEPLVTNE